MKTKAITTIMTILLLASMLSVAVPLVSASPSPSILWGVTGVWVGGTGPYPGWSEVFKVDTATGVVTMVNNIPSNPLYGDIAMTPNGNLYATGADSNIQAPNGWWVINFNDFYRLNPATGAVLQKWSNVFTDAGFHRVNALAAESSTSLLAIEGGGVGIGWGYPTGPRLLRIQLDAAGNFLSITNLGPISAPGAASCLSDGDLDRDPMSGKWYGGFWAGAGSEMLELNLGNPGASTLKSQSNIKWQGGFAFDCYGSAYAGSWAEKKLYSVNVIGGGSTVLYDLSSYLQGCVYGLSVFFPKLRFVSPSDSIVAKDASAILTVQVTYDTTAPVPGVTVTFSSDPPGLTFTPAAPSTGSGGYATVTATTTTADVYTVTATVCGAISDTWTLVFYEPVGMAAGGGWYYPLDDTENSMPGTASFGFIAKYIKGSSTGNLEFQYHVEDKLNLKSTSITYLVVSGSNAHFGGTATVDGVSGYYFRVIAQDKGEPGVGKDTFAIKIWYGDPNLDGTLIHSSHNTLAGGNIMVRTK